MTPDYVALFVCGISLGTVIGYALAVLLMMIVWYSKDKELSRKTRIVLERRRYLSDERRLRVIQNNEEVA